MDTSQSILLVLFLVAWNSAQFGVQAKNGFIFTMPKVLRHGGTSEFCLTLHDENETQQYVRFALTNSEQKDTLVEDYFPVGSQKCRKFSVPIPGDYNLHLYNETDVMHDSVPITVLGNKLITLVQTDKPMYKPGQKVKFRVLTLMSDLKPRVGTIKSIFIIDPNSVRVKQYLNLETKGISSLEFQLAAETKFGKWKIEILVDDYDEEYQKVTLGQFEVMEYVLPRFEVEIIPPAYVLVNQKTVEVKVCAKYNYGKNVSGILDLDVCWGSSYAPARDCVKNIVEISGCHSFMSPVANISTGYHYFGHELQIKASVTEYGTGVKVDKSHSGPAMSYEPLKINLEDYSNGHFKPGLPFYGKVIVTKPDGTPAEGELIKITARDTQNDLIFSKTFTTDSYGVVVYSLCGHFTEISNLVSIYAEAESYQTVGRLNTPRGFQQINQWFSPSLSYIQIPRTDSSHKCGDRLTLSIPFTTTANTDIEFNYQVMAQGKVIKTGQISYTQTTNYPGGDLILPPSDICLHENYPITPPDITSEIPVTSNTLEENADLGPPTEEIENREVDPIPYPFGRFHHVEEINDDELLDPIIRSENVSNMVSNFLLDLAITPVMSPKFTLLVYYIMPDGEVVADSMQFLVNPCFDNQVKMEFDHASVLPGETVDINLKAAPGSVCGVGIVDKSVNILGGKHQITPENVLDKIEEFNSAEFEDHSIPYHWDSYCKDRIQKLHGKQENYFSYSSPFVDAKQAFKATGFLVLSNLNLETRPCTSQNQVMYATVLDSDGDFLVQRLGSSRNDIQKEIRSHFPETWLWNLITVGETGETVLKETAPHTITSWVGNAMCLDQDKGFGISKMTSLTTFQPFFLSLHLPYAAVRGERLPVMFTVHNYLEKCLHIQLTLDLGKNFKIHNSKLHQNPICVCGGKSYTAKFYATATEIGNLPVFAKAEIVPGMCGNTIDVDTTHVGLSDAVKRQILVKVEGIVQEYTHTSYICSKVNEPVQEDVILPLPGQGEMIKNSARGEVTVIGDIMGPALTNLNSLVRMPTGCGEQNMIGFVPNILVLKYLTSINKFEKEIQENAVKYMEIGYQRELTFQHNDGSYSAFGKNDPEGSVWLTAFVVKSFAQAKPFIYIDEKDLTLSLKFLRRCQLETGCFRETGKVFQSYMMGGLGKDKDTESNTALTAYVLIALLSANVSTAEPVISGSLLCINSDFHQNKEKIDPYTLSLVAYANSLHQPSSRISNEILMVLESKAQINGSLRYWSRETSKPKPVNTWFYYAASSAEVEMTSYALMAYLNIYGKRAIEHSHNIAMWLSQQRNPNGGFSSTQDTVVGLQALSEFASLAHSKEGTAMQISISGKQLNTSFSVSEREDTTLLLQAVLIPVLPNELKITVKGTGCALVQASVHYNKQPKDVQGDETSGFHLKVTTTKYEQDIDKCNRATIALSVGKKGNLEVGNGMSLVTVKMVTSWTPTSKSLTKLKSLFPVLGIKKLEYSEEQGVLTFYFDEFTRQHKEFSIDVEQDKDLAISNSKPAEVKVFQYYETDVSVVEFYQLKTICGTKAEIPRNVSNTDPENDLLEQRRVDLNLVPAPGNRAGDVCPVCIPIKHEPKNLKEMVCNSTAVYKAVAGRKGAYPLKLIQDIRPQKKDKLNIFSNYKMVTGCDCTVLEAPVKRVIILVHNAVSSDHMLLLDRASMVVLADKKIEKQVRKFRKSCSLKS